MTENQYFMLCQACDKVLTESGRLEDRIGISWLHVIREHPVFLKKYNFLFGLSSWRMSILFDVIISGRDFVFALLRLVRALLSSQRNAILQSPEYEKADFLLVSHLVSPLHFDRSEDFYFGVIPKELSERGYSVVIALINHTGLSADTFEDIKSKRSVRKLVLDDYLDFGSELLISKRLRKEYKLLKKWGEAETEGFLKRVLRAASYEARGCSSHTTYRIATQIANLAIKLKPRVLVVPYEGHPWERASLNAARVSVPSIRCVGYQHAAIFEHQHAIRRPLGKNFDPDTILTAGAVSLRQLRAVPSLSEIQMAILGSPRAQRPNKRKSIAEKKRDLPSFGDMCLVLPEGIEEECLFLFKFSMACARLRPDITFVWRLHPIIQFSKLVNVDLTLKNLPANVRISSNSLEQDVLSARWALYRGSTVIVQAIVAGAEPIYVKKPDEMPIDPLYEVRHMITNISTAEEFKAATRVKTAQEQVSWHQSSESLQCYCDAFYMPINIDVLLGTLESEAKPSIESSFA